MTRREIPLDAAAILSVLADYRVDLVRALESLGAGPVGASGPSPVRLPDAGVLELDTTAGGVDVHLDPPGAAPYEKLRGRALELELEVPVRVAGLDDLIAMKSASGRPIDRSDVLALTEQRDG